MLAGVRHLSNRSEGGCARLRHAQLGILLLHASASQRRLVHSSASKALGPSLRQGPWRAWPAVSGLILGALAWTAGTANAEPSEGQALDALKSLRNEPCVKKLLAIEGIEPTHSAGQMLRRHSVLGRLVAQDHWFDGLEDEQMVQEMLCLYDKNAKRFYCCMRVGRCVAISLLW